MVEIEYILRVKAWSYEPMLKGLLNVRRLAILGSLLGAGSLVFGLFYFDSNLRPLQERVSDDGTGYLLEQLHEPNRFERETGRKSLEQWLDLQGKDRYKLAYDMVRGKTLNGMDIGQVLDSLGGPTKAQKDSVQRFKFSVKGPKESGELYITFGQEAEPKVSNTCLFIPGEERDKK